MRLLHVAQQRMGRCTTTFSPADPTVLLFSTEPAISRVTLGAGEVLLHEMLAVQSLKQSQGFAYVLDEHVCKQPVLLQVA